MKYTRESLGPRRFSLRKLKDSSQTSSEACERLRAHMALRMPASRAAATSASAEANMDQSDGESENFSAMGKIFESHPAGTDSQLLTGHIASHRRGKSRDMSISGKDGKTLVDALVASRPKLGEFERLTFVDTWKLDDPQSMRRIGVHPQILKASAENRLPDIADYLCRAAMHFQLPSVAPRQDNRTPVDYMHIVGEAAVFVETGAKPEPPGMTLVVPDGDDDEPSAAAGPSRLVESKPNAEQARMIPTPKRKDGTVYFCTPLKLDEHQMATMNAQKREHNYTGLFNVGEKDAAITKCLTDVKMPLTGRFSAGMASGAPLHAPFGAVPAGGFAGPCGQANGPLPGTVLSPRAQMPAAQSPGDKATIVSHQGGSGSNSMERGRGAGGSVGGCLAPGVAAEAALLRLGQRALGSELGPGPGLEVLRLFAARPEELRLDELLDAVSVLPLGLSRAEVQGVFSHLRRPLGAPGGPTAPLFVTASTTIRVARDVGEAMEANVDILSGRGGGIRSAQRAFLLAIAGARPRLIFLRERCLCRRALGARDIKTYSGCARLPTHAWGRLSASRELVSAKIERRHLLGQGVALTQAAGFLGCDWGLQDDLPDMGVSSGFGGAAALARGAADDPTDAGGLCLAQRLSEAGRVCPSTSQMLFRRLPRTGSTAKGASI
ncbi:unnamed protein product [Prorocentrum cordatum]|uniref:Uncharacterized protein n=1 Tax=Prorocentrum cordatum TaxID=2364126 RepID=A0ABN9S5C3_9DINO|nr:unnamed protein product [Polarella glacialis]